MRRVDYSGTATAGVRPHRHETHGSGEGPLSTLEGIEAWTAERKTYSWGLREARALMKERLARLLEGMAEIEIEGLYDVMGIEAAPDRWLARQMLRVIGWRVGKSRCRLRADLMSAHRKAELAAVERRLRNELDGLIPGRVKEVPVLARLVQATGASKTRIAAALRRIGWAVDGNVVRYRRPKGRRSAKVRDGLEHNEMVRKAARWRERAEEVEKAAAEALNQVEQTRRLIEAAQHRRQAIELEDQAARAAARALPVVPPEAGAAFLSAARGLNRYKQVHPDVVAIARTLRGDGLSYRAISAELLRRGYRARTGRAYQAETIRRVLARTPSDGTSDAG